MPNASPLNEDAADSHVFDAEQLPTRHPHEGTLTLISTPIGNLGDIGERALATLANADLVLCEDTRMTSRLLLAKSISVRTEPLHDHNERQRIPAILAKLSEGAHIAIVSDAGTPLLSDPGFRLVSAAIDAGIRITAIPGPNAAITALTLSGLPPHPFMFLGFPPPRESARREAFGRLRAAEQAGLSSTLIWHEAPHRVIEMLRDASLVFGDDRPAAVARELTKRFEEVIRGSIASLIAHFEEVAPRGEMTVLLGPPSEEDNGAQDLDTHLRNALKTHSVKDAATLVATVVNLPRRTVYNRAIELAQELKD